MLLILVIVLVVLAFGGGLARPDSRNVLWTIAAVLLIFWLVGGVLR